MSQAAQIVDVVKQALRDRGKTYATLAAGLGLSESSVKRLFSKKRLSLERLEQICAQLDLDVSDLLELAGKADRRLTELTQAQEQALVDNPKLLLVGLRAMSHWTAAQMGRAYRLSEVELVQLLTRLDKLRIIDLLPGNRIKLRLARHFAWRRDGPLQRFFEASVQREFFESSFSRPDELRFVVHGSLSSHSIALLQQRVRKLAEEFDALAEDDRRLDPVSLAVTTMVVAARPWELAAFTAMRRDDGDPAAPPLVSPSSPP